jgi:hypothetical protein
VRLGLVEHARCGDALVLRDGNHAGVHRVDGVRVQTGLNLNKLTEFLNESV